MHADRLLSAGELQAAKELWASKSTPKDRVGYITWLTHHCAQVQ